MLNYELICDFRKLLDCGYENVLRFDFFIFDVLKFKLSIIVCNGMCKFLNLGDIVMMVEEFGFNVLLLSFDFIMELKCFF